MKEANGLQGDYVEKLTSFGLIPGEYLRQFMNFSVDTRIYIYIYIYIFLCVCVRIYIYQSLTRMWHKVTFLAEFNRFELSFPSSWPVTISKLKSPVCPIYL